MLESMIRFYIAVIIFVMAVALHEYILLCFGLILTYTAISKRCFIYRIIGRENKVGLENYYKSLVLDNFPYYLVFDEDGDKVFESEKFENIIHIVNMKKADENFFEIRKDIKEGYSIIYLIKKA
jgi:nicotinic acid mononucleotide adenylyltransferase